MANVKISELTTLAPPAAADLVPVTDSSASQTKRTTVGEIVGIINGDVDVANDGAATISELPVSKLQDGDARQLLQTDAAGTGVEWTDDVDIPGTLGVTGQSTLASASVSDLTSGRVVLAGTSGELEDNAGLAFDGSELAVTGTLDVSSNGTIGGNLTVVGDLTVEGTTTTLETQTVKVEDKNIELGVVDPPTDTTADGGGITLKGATDKTINWVDATDAWTFSEHVDIASAKEFRIAGTKVLDATSLGSAVVSSSLTSVGTIGTGTWQGTAIDDTYLDTISTAGKVSNSATTATDANTASAIVARDASGNFSAGTITADLTGNADTATALETARDIGGVSFNGTANISLPGVNTTGNQDTSGNAATATKLNSSRTFAVTGDVTGTVSSDLTIGASITTSIASGVIVDGDVNASAAIAGTKIDPDFGSQTVETTGVFSAAGGAEATPSITFTGDLNTGIYSPGANQLAISTDGVQALYINSDGDILVADGNRMEIDEIRARDGAGLKLFDDAGAGIFIEDGGNVGFGTIYPDEALHIAGLATAKINIESSSSTGISGIQFGDPDDINVGRIQYEHTSDYMYFETNASEAIRIDSSGRVLVGLSTLASGGNASAEAALFVVQARVGSNIDSGRINLQRGSIPSSSPQGIGSIYFTDSSNNCYAIIESLCDGSTGSGDYPGCLVFSVTADGSASPTEALRISNDRSITVSDGGDVVLGTTTGTKIGTATSQKIGFYNATPVVQPTIGVAEAAFVENSGGTAVNVDSTFGGYTIQQVVEALQTLGLLA